MITEYAEKLFEELVNDSAPKAYLLQDNRVVAGPVECRLSDGNFLPIHPFKVTQAVNCPIIQIYHPNGAVVTQNTFVRLLPGDSLSFA